MSATRCTEIRASGEQCKAPAVHGSALCWFHNPDVEGERTAAQKLGGRRGVADTPHIQATDAARLAKMLLEAANAVRDGRLSAPRAQALAAVVRAYSALNSVLVLEQRLNERMQRVEEMVDAESRRQTSAG